MKKIDMTPDQLKFLDKFIEVGHTPHRLNDDPNEIVIDERNGFKGLACSTCGWAFAWNINSSLYLMPECQTMVTGKFKAMRIDIPNKPN